MSGQVADRMGTCRLVSESEMLKSSARSDSRELRRLWCGAAGCCGRAVGWDGPAGALRLKASVWGSVGDFLPIAVCCRHIPSMSTLHRLQQQGRAVGPVCHSPCAHAYHKQCWLTCEEREGDNGNRSSSSGMAVSWAFLAFISSCITKAAHVVEGIRALSGTAQQQGGVKLAVPAQSQAAGGCHRLLQSQQSGPDAVSFKA